MSEKKRSNKEQIKFLVEYMSTDPLLAAGEFTGPLGNRRALAQWQKLKELLKNYGPDRSINQWKQTWKDLKKHARHENALNRQGLLATGNIDPVPSVSDVSQKVLTIIGHDSSIGIGPAESIIGPIVENSAHFAIASLEQPIADPLPELPLSPPTVFPHHFPHSLGHDYYKENEENVPLSLLHTEQSPNTFCIPHSQISTTPLSSTPQPYTTPKQITSMHQAPGPSRRPHARTTRTARPYDVFSGLQTEHNAILQNIVTLMTEKNLLLKEQNRLLSEANVIASKKK